jgi:hypothetical protein
VGPEVCSIGGLVQLGMGAVQGGEDVEDAGNFSYEGANPEDAFTVVATICAASLPWGAELNGGIEGC